MMISIYDLEFGGLISEAVADLPPDFDPAWMGQAVCPDLPDHLRVWSPEARGYCSDVAILRELLWGRTRALRDQAADGGCATPLGHVQTDERSRGLIAGAVLEAKLAMDAGAPFKRAWTMADNVAVDHDGPAMIAMGLAVMAHVSACHDAATAIRDEIMGATLEDLAAIDIEAGYP